MIQILWIAVIVINPKNKKINKIMMMPKTKIPMMKKIIVVVVVMILQTKMIY